MKLAIAIASLSLSIAAPVLACPMEDHGATRTAEKAKDEPASAKETAKSDQAKPADKAKAAKPAKPADKAKDAKPADKVSQR